MPTLLDADAQFLRTEAGATWLAGTQGREWRQIMSEEFHVDVDVLRGQA
jgi:hypothetical protein